MNFFKKSEDGGKIMSQNPEIMVMIGIVGGVLIGVGTDNIGLGIALGVVFGVTGYSTYKKKADKTDEGK